MSYTNSTPTTPPPYAAAALIPPSTTVTLEQDALAGSSVLIVDPSVGSSVGTGAAVFGKGIAAGTTVTGIASAQVWLSAATASGVPAGTLITFAGVA